MNWDNLRATFGHDFRLSCADRQSRPITDVGVPMTVQERRLRCWSSR
jgi:hypothetical protein